MKTGEIKNELAHHECRYKTPSSDSSRVYTLHRRATAQTRPSARRWPNAPVRVRRTTARVAANASVRTTSERRCAAPSARRFFARQIFVSARRGGARRSAATARRSAGVGGNRRRRRAQCACGARESGSEWTDETTEGAKHGWLRQRFRTLLANLANLCAAEWKQVKVIVFR